MDMSNLCDRTKHKLKWKIMGQIGKWGNEGIYRLGSEMMMIMTTLIMVMGVMTIAFTEHLTLEQILPVVP